MPFCGGHHDGFAGDFFFGEFTGGIAEIEIGATRQRGANANAVAFTGEKDLGCLALKGERFGNFSDGNDGRGAVRQRGDH